ncbi:NAD(P)H-hydrate dehydratase [Methanofollis fontis]|uniref:Bifunctional NAD(P)H-hydrate repair enzyme n=1 Tax=Methanofollis fontis TaxID=2052832 RepID=A0A483CM79_9EURY|nr:NAD(P)H-hydrate dehydratase [Methanofollis fontis]TAJ43661.1 bifunctional ADP-dependent NAD(P)H-hydrate dehydratase/NAD(P)H-hydrate epimerase [Methanofollis fontis]
MQDAFSFDLRDLAGFCEGGIITPERMRAVDQNAIALGVPGIRLMEAAAAALAVAVRESDPERVLLLCGRGNNGGDGLAAARHLQDLECTAVIPADGRATPEFLLQREALLHAAVDLREVRTPVEVEALEPLFREADVIVDAMLGTGASGTVRQPLSAMVRLMNESAARVVAADVPTPDARSDLVLAFHRPKTAGARTAGIGIPVAAEICTGPGDLLCLRPKGPTAHKGAGGEVLVVGGGPYQGAPFLAGMAALRAGADIVRVASPVYVPCPDLIHVPLSGTLVGEEHSDLLIPIAERADVVLCGNGLGPGSHGVVKALAPHAKKLVIDADALRTPLPAGAETIYTPHAAEFRRAFGRPLPAGMRERAETVRDAAPEDSAILLKGAVDIISDGRRVRFNRSGCPAMTVGGTGDVLAGVAAALFCRLPAFEAACAAAHANGLAGERAAGGRDAGLIATEMLPWIAEVLYG